MLTRSKLPTKAFRPLKYKLIKLSIIGLTISLISALALASGVPAYKKHVSPHAIGYLKGVVDDLSILPLIIKIKTLNEGDWLDVYIDSPGGSTASYFKLMKAVKDQKIHINAIVQGADLVASAAANFMS